MLLTVSYQRPKLGYRSKMNSTLRRSSSQLQKYQAARLNRWIKPNTLTHSSTTAQFITSKLKAARLPRRIGLRVVAQKVCGCNDTRPGWRFIALRADRESFTLSFYLFSFSVMSSGQYQSRCFLFSFFQELRWIFSECAVIPFSGSFCCAYYFPACMRFLQGFLHTILKSLLKTIYSLIQGCSAKKRGVWTPFPPHYTQGRNEVRWRPGREASLAPPCPNLRSFDSNLLH